MSNKQARAEDKDKVIMAGFRKMDEELAKQNDLINNWIKQIDGIDNVAFACMYMMANDTKEFIITAEGIARTQEKIDGVIKEFHRYRDERAAEVAEKANQPAPIKLIKPKARKTSGSGKILLK